MPSILAWTKRNPVSFAFRPAGAYALHTWIIGIWTTYAVLFRTTVIRRMDVLRPCWRPLCATATMYLVVRAFLWYYPGHESLAHSLIALICATLIGFLVYVGVLLGLWTAAGRPSGSETALLWRLRVALDRLRRRGKPKLPG